MKAHTVLLMKIVILVFYFSCFSAKTPGLDDANKIMKHRVTMVGWSLYDTHVITAVNDHSLRVWDSRSGKLVQEFVVSRFECYFLRGRDDTNM